ncbi:MAG TPA: hypothetical protein VHV83_04120, partial [Armatimonadota bacterium]|nr:hypothetical protein [Armatimonadota bacterium]
QAEAVLVDLNSDLVAPIQQLAKISKTFVENINTDYQCSLSVTPSLSEIDLGVSFTSDYPLFLIHVTEKEH